MNPPINRLDHLTATRAPRAARPYVESLDALPAVHAVDPAVSAAVRRTMDYLLSQQHPEGYWVGELEGDTILESEYALLLAWLGGSHDETLRNLAAYVERRQLPTGGWALFPGGPLEVSQSVKAYWAMKLAGHDVESEPMRRARAAIVAAGGA